MTPLMAILLLFGAELPALLLVIAIVADTIILSVAMIMGVIHT